MSGRPTLSSVVELEPPDLEQPGSSPLEAVEEQADLPPEGPWLYLYILIQKKFNWYAFHTDTRTSIRTENFLKKVTKKLSKNGGVWTQNKFFGRVVFHSFANIF